MYRKRSLYILFFTFCICAFPLHAQQVISPDKVKEAFQHATDTFSLDGYDKMLNYNEYLAGCPNLRNAGGIALPPSYWGLMIVDEDGQCSFENHTVFLEEGEQGFLCWMGFREPSPEEDRVRRKLKKRHGSIVTSDGKTEGIPAKWLTTDNLAFSTSVKYYGGLYTGSASKPAVRKGRLLLDETREGSPIPIWHEPNPWDYFDEEAHQNSKATLCYQVDKMTFDYIPSHQFEREQRLSLRRFMETMLLAYEANRFCPSSFIPDKYHPIQDLPLYIYMRKDGRCEMTILDDNMLKDEDMPYVEELAKALPQMLPLLLSLNWTIDGMMMPGMIVYASRELSWTFRQLGQDDN